MARTPRASVSKTSGQGVSRSGYQTSYALGQRGTGSPAGGTGLRFKQPDRREYGKTSGKVDPPTKMNVSYGNTYHPTDLAEVTRTPPKRSK